MKTRRVTWAADKHRVLKAGTRVVLPADDDEGWDEERGVLEAVDGAHEMVTVRLDDEFLDGEDDDGLRETGMEFCVPENEYEKARTT